LLYRGINIDLNAVMRQKYDAYETAFAVGTKLTFPAPTACSTSDVVAGHFMNGIQLVIQKAGGVALVPGQLSAYDESEVLLPFPSTFKVIARSKVQDTVVVMIEAMPTSFSYCSAPEKPFLATWSSSSSSSAEGGSATVLSPALAPVLQSPVPLAAELQALADIFVALKVGLPESCAAFAVHLGKEGVMAVEDFSAVSEEEALDMMARAGMSILQQNKVIQAFAEQRKVRFVPPEPRVAVALMSRVAHACSQAAAAARIKVKPGIIQALKSGDVKLVQDHVTADKLCVGCRDSKQ
jgi:hypothetical protein